MTICLRIDQHDAPGAPRPSTLAAVLAHHLGLPDRLVTSGYLPMEWGGITPAHVTLRTDDEAAVREAAELYLDSAHVDWRFA